MCVGIYAVCWDVTTAWCWTAPNRRRGEDSAGGGGFAAIFSAKACWRITGKAARYLPPGLLPLAPLPLPSGLLLPTPRTSDASCCLGLSHDPLPPHLSPASFSHRLSSSSSASSLLGRFEQPWAGVLSTPPSSPSYLWRKKDTTLYTACHALNFFRMAAIPPFSCGWTPHRLPAFLSAVLLPAAHLLSVCLLSSSSR